MSQQPRLVGAEEGRQLRHGRRRAAELEPVAVAGESDVATPCEFKHSFEGGRGHSSPSTTPPASGSSRRRWPGAPCWPPSEEWVWFSLVFSKVANCGPLGGTWPPSGAGSSQYHGPPNPIFFLATRT